MDAWKEDNSNLTSRGTILTRDANVFVAVARTSSSGSLIRPNTGTTMKITYGSALMSSFCTMSGMVCERRKAVEPQVLTIDELDGALAVRQHRGIPEVWHHLLDNISHGFHCQDVTYRGEAPGSRLSDDGEAAAESEDHVWEQLHEVMREVGVESGHDGFEYAQRVDDVLTVALLNLLIHLLDRFCTYR